MEIFRQIKQYPMYSVSTEGRVRKDTVGKIMKPSKKPNGYMQLNLFTGDGRRKKEYVHRLVAITFIPNVKGEPEVNHIDGVRDNNRVENLEWVSHQENVEKGTVRKKIRVYTKTGELVGCFVSIKDACETFGLIESNVSSCLHGGLQKSHRGYTFQLSE